MPNAEDRLSGRKGKERRYISRISGVIMSDIVDITDLLTKAQCFCLNQDSAHPFSNLFVGDETLYLQSDADEQLLINLVFRTTVKLHSIDFVASCEDEDTAPTGVKLYTNLQSPGFSDVEDLPPAQKLELTPDSLTRGTPINLKLVKFLHVNSLTIFIDENNGGAVTTLSGLKMYGSALDSVNVAAIHERKQEG